MARLGLGGLPRLLVFVGSVSVRGYCLVMKKKLKMGVKKTTFSYDTVPCPHFKIDLLVFLYMCFFLFGCDFDDFDDFEIVVGFNINIPPPLPSLEPEALLVIYT